MLFAFVTTPAILLEVMDKEPSLLQIWIEVIVIGIGGFLLSRYRFWLAFIVCPIALLFAWVQTSELRDPYVGPAIVNEAGRGYVVQSYLAMALYLTLPILGAVLNWRKMHKTAT